MQTKKFLLILTYGNGYTNEIEKINRDDSDMSIIITLETLLLLQKKKMRLHVTVYYQGEYLYSLSCEELIMNYKGYGVNKPISVMM